MAFENLVHQIPGLQAAGDLSTKQFYIVKKTTTALQVDVCGDGELPIGVLLDKPAAAGRAAAVAGVGSVVRVVSAAAVTAGDKVSSDTAGKAILAQDGDWMLGIALDTTANAGELVTVYICPVCLGIDDDT